MFGWCGMQPLGNVAAPEQIVAPPLSDASALRLAAALLADDEAGRREHFYQAVLHDGPLTLWSLCLADRSGAGELPDAAQLAAWLAGRGRAALLHAACQVARDSSEPRANHPSSDDAIRSRALACIAARLARDGGLDHEQAHFLGLLYAACRSCAIECRAPGGTPAMSLPDWLDRQLRAVDEATSAQPRTIAEAVAAALRSLEHRPADREVSAECILFADRAGAGQPQIAGGLIARLTTRLVRLDELERDFAAALERGKLASLKELAYGAGHEINNPLANISARAQTLLTSEQDPKRRRLLASINAQAFRAHEMIADMMLFARPPQPKFERVDLTPLLARLVDELQPLAAEQGTLLAIRAPGEPVSIEADPAQIAVAVRALCVNALEALVQGGRVEVSLALPVHSRASENPLDSREYVQIIVSDNGPGIPAEVRQHIFDPFYSGREAGRGLGFGLPKCWRIVTMHGGRIAVESGAAGGARLIICLPSTQNS